MHAQTMLRPQGCVDGLAVARSHRAQSSAHRCLWPQTPTSRLSPAPLAGAPSTSATGRAAGKQPQLVAHALPGGHKPHGSPSVKAAAYATAAQQALRVRELREALDHASRNAVFTSWEPDELEEPLPYAATLGKASWVRHRAHLDGPNPSVVQGFFTAKGPTKSSMQDYFVAVSDNQGSSLWSMASPDIASAVQQQGLARPFCLTGVFDGHGAGDHAARTAQESTLQAIAGDPEVLASISGSGSSMSSASDTDDEIAMLREMAFDEQRVMAVASAFRSAFARLDERICAESEERGLQMDGTTALVSLQLGRLVYTANAGDSRAVLCRNGVGLRISRDHKPELMTERARIEAAGGRVANVRGTWRVVLPLPNGVSAKVCAVSRGFGDRDFKAQSLISAEPDITALVLQPRQDTFAVHASDGLWGVMDDQEAVNITQAVLAQYAKTRHVNRQTVATACARELVKVAQQRGSMDDITVVVTLYGWE